MSGAWIKYVVFAAAVAAGAHVAWLYASPRLAMQAAMEDIGADGWAAEARIEPGASGGAGESERPSPDFAVARCVFDLTRGPAFIRTAPWGDYWSLSLYGANSDNFFTLNDREAPRGADIVLIRAGKRAPNTSAQIVSSPSARGVAIIRRLAPTGDAHAGAQRAGRDDVCAPLQAATS